MLFVILNRIFRMKLGYLRFKSVRTNFEITSEEKRNKKLEKFFK